MTQQEMEYLEKLENEAYRNYKFRTDKYSSPESMEAFGRWTALYEIVKHFKEDVIEKTKEIKK